MMRCIKYKHNKMNWAVNLMKNIWWLEQISKSNGRAKTRKFFIEKIKEEQEQADSNIKSGDLMSAMAHKLTAEWYSSMLALL